jgi:hypothetical protein
MNQGGKTRKKKKFKGFHMRGVRCAPKMYNELNLFSCYTDKNLFILRDAWNQKNPKNKITSNNGEQIHEQLSLKMKKICNSEDCWLSKLLTKQQLKSIEAESFAPEQPGQWKSNPNEWLSSEDINRVMKQYEKAYKCFKFLGPTPIDFDTKISSSQCVENSLCNFQINNYINKGIFKIGIIFNTDPHTKGGEHWISMFINLKKGEIFFFDSVGTTAPPEVKAFVKRIQEQGKKINLNLKYDENHPVEHQYGNTECGIYSLFFIVHMLQDKITKHYLKTHILKDKYMSEFRNKYFNKKQLAKGGKTRKRIL